MIVACAGRENTYLNLVCRSPTTIIFTLKQQTFLT